MTIDLQSAIADWKAQGLLPQRRAVKLKRCWFEKEYELTLIIAEAVMVDGEPCLIKTREYFSTAHQATRRPPTAGDKDVPRFWEFANFFAGMFEKTKELTMLTFIDPGDPLAKETKIAILRELFVLKVIR